MRSADVVSTAEWQAARERLLAEEKEASRARDALAAERRRLPVVRARTANGAWSICTRADGNETLGLSVFVRDAESVFRSYFTSARRVEALGSVWTLLDRTPFGRQEVWEDSPSGTPQTTPHTWWRRHNEYDENDNGRELT